MEDVHATIEKLLNNKEISSYRIKKDNRVSYGTICELRKEKDN